MDSTTPPDAPEQVHIALIGAGTIGLSFAALHLQTTPPPAITIIDTRPSLSEYIHRTLPAYLPSHLNGLIQDIQLTSDISAVRTASIVQESGPENLPFKLSLWPQIEHHAPATALFWSSTSGIPASAQAAGMKDPSRLLVVHPYNPPHVMPLLEIVPSPQTAEDVVSRTVAFWRERGREPVVLRKEVTGFVANRLAFALLREAVHLVQEGVVGVEELDRIVESSMGPRWSVAGPFKSYHAGGGEGGLEGFFQNIGGTVQGCWDDSGKANVGDGWEERVFREAKEAYGKVDTKERDRVTKAVLEVVAKEKEKSSS